MKVKMLTTSAGPSGTVHAGAVVNVSDSEAKELIDGRFAVAVSGVESDAEEAGPIAALLAKSAPEVIESLAGLTNADLDAALEAEQDDKARKTVLAAIEAEIDKRSAEGSAGA